MDSAYNVRSRVFKGYGILRVGVLYFKDNKKKNNKNSVNLIHVLKNIEL